MLIAAVIYLLAAVISVPIAKKLGLGSVLGYLIAGVLIGPYALKLVGDQTSIMHFAEFGVVMMLFLIGLELKPNKLWTLRKPILGLGGMQIIATSCVFFAGLYYVGNLPWQTSLALGMTLSLSSTAIALQSLSERGLLSSQAGNNAFSVLLAQDIAVIPMLAILPLLALTSLSKKASSHDHSLIEHLAGWQQYGIITATIVGIILAGKYLSNPIFRIIAETKLREIFTAFALLIVIVIAVIMQAVGLSPALGTFLAGVVLAESEFRHELEADIEPFKGLLLGLFFITVGASINFPLLLDKPLFIFSCLALLIATKSIILIALARIFKMNLPQGLLFTVILAQGGEFSFVLISTAAPFAIFPGEIANLLTLVVALSMLISPLLFVAYEAFMGRATQKPSQKDDDINETGDVIIAGYGRFGQIVGRLLNTQGYRLTILDHSPSQIELLRRFGNRVFYGDASRKELLKAAGAETAKILIIAVDEPDKTLEIITLAQTHFPHLKILARAIDRRHTYEIMKKNIAGFQRETFHSALHMGVDAMQLLGASEAHAKRAGEIFSQHDEQSLKVLAEVWGDDKSYGIAVRQRIEDLKQVLSSDQQTLSLDAAPQKSE